MTVANERILEALIVFGLVGASCSTVAEPVEDGPPVCQYCDAGTQELRCQMLLSNNDGFVVYLGEAAYVCVEPDATEPQKEQACLDSCEDYAGGHELAMELVCEFGQDPPFLWSGCVPPEDPTGGEAGYECPGWYVPVSRIYDYEGSLAEAMVTIERGFIDELQLDVFALYVCDDARYVEHRNGWVFDGVGAGDLLFELGIRDGDRNAAVQGVDPQTMELTTEEYVLDSVDQMQAAIEGLVDAKGVRVVVERSAVASGQWVGWISIE